ncbi:MAG: glycosyl hydrolase, partial [Vicinamibacterales bacterium]
MTQPMSAARRLRPRLQAGVVAWALVLAAAPVTAAEIIANGGFEVQSGGTAAGWLPQGTAPAYQILAIAAPHSGAWSLRVSGRGDELDGPRQAVTTALALAGSGRTYAFRFWIRLDDVASVRALLKTSDASGPRADLILAERVVLAPGQWTLVEGTATVAWQGALQAAAIVFEVVQLSRQSGVLPSRLVPAYDLDDVSMDTDTDGDGLMDRDEPALGLDAGAADSDGDGLPDRWERDHRFSAAANEAGVDTDGDGFTNRQEFFAATDPRSAASYPGRPANPNANAATRAVLRWLALLPAQGATGHLAVGQNVSDLLSATEYPDMVDRLGAITGRYPAILALAVEPVLDGPGIPLQIDQAESRALAYWQAGGLVLLKWAIYNPWVTRSPGVQTNANVAGLLAPATAADQAARDTLVGWMSTVADAVARLDRQGVVVMLRPMSEMNGNWFWWGRRERGEYVALWRFVYDYFTHTRGLNNIIWVYESDSGTHAPAVAGGQGFASDYYYPGDDYVDVFGHNLYSATWVLRFDANEVYRRYPKVYGVPQAGPDHSLRDGTFDNLTYVVQSEARLPRSSFFIAWNDFGTPLQLLSIVGNANAAALMHHPAVVTREGLPAFNGPAAGGPTNLAAIVTGTSVAFSWSPPPGGAAGGYLLEAAASAGGAANATLPVAQAAVTVTGVPVGTYNVRVRAVGGALASNEG